MLILIFFQTYCTRTIKFLHKFLFKEPKLQKPSRVFNQVNAGNKTLLLSLFLPQIGAWLAAPPTLALNLHLQPSEHRKYLKHLQALRFMIADENVHFAKLES